jgi:hypothetical protein
MFTRLSDRASILSNVVGKIPPKKYHDTVNTLTTFVNNIESVLLSDHAVMSDENTMKEKIQRFKELQLSFNSHKNNFEYINKVGQDFISKINDDTQIHRITEELQDLNTKWSDIPIILEERLQKLSKGKLYYNIDIIHTYIHTYIHKHIQTYIILIYYLRMNIKDLIFIICNNNIL